MQAGDRIQWASELGPTLGTVLRVSPAGYVYQLHPDGIR